MEHISYDSSKGRYVFQYNGKTITSKDIDTICKKALERMKDNIVDTKIYENIKPFKIYEDFISYKCDNIELYDLEYTMQYLNYCEGMKVKVRNDLVNRIEDSFRKNKYGGYILRRYIDNEQLHILLSQSSKVVAIKLCKLLGINTFDVIISKEQKWVDAILTVFDDLEYELQYNIDKYYIDLCFIKYKIAIECDENNHNNYDKHEEKIRQDVIENMGYKIIRFNPDDKDFNIFVVINKIYKLIQKNEK
jgi:very-short-patch-repair endonuclease